MEVGIVIFALFILFRPVFPIVKYLLFQEYIASELENKDKPQIHCDEKCHLAKELSKVIDDSPSSAEKEGKPIVLKFSLLFFEEILATPYISILCN